MAIHVWSVLCENTILDKYNNNFSLFNVLEEISLEAPPQGELPSNETIQIHGIRLCVLTLWTRTDLAVPEKETYLFRIKLIAKDTERSKHAVTLSTSNEGKIDLEHNKRFRTRFRIDRLSFAGPGLYHFQVELKKGKGKWREVDKVPLEVQLQYADSEDGSEAKTTKG